MLKEAFDSVRVLTENQTPIRKFALDEAWRILMDAEIMDPILDVREITTPNPHIRLSPKLGRRERVPEIPLEGDEIPLGTTIRLRRQMLGLSLKEVAGKVGDYLGSPGSYTDVYIGFLELGKRKLSDEMLERLAPILGSTKEELKTVSREQLLKWKNAVPKYTKQR